MKKLNIGCGKLPKKGFMNLDIIELPGVDIIHDLEKIPYPFKDNEFDLIEANGVLEHLRDLPSIMRELFRILKPGGMLHITLIPHFTSVNAYVDPTHKNLFSYETMEYFTSKHKYNYYFDFGFSKIDRKLKFNKTIYEFWNYIIEFLINLHPKIIKFYENTFLRNIFPACCVEVKLIK